jgi:hypothetical protein
MKAIRPTTYQTVEEVEEVNKPMASKTPKQLYDTIRERETANELLSERDWNENVSADLTRLRTHIEPLQTVHKVADRKSIRR